MDIDNFVDWLWATFYVGLFYISKFVFVGGILEYTNPIPKTEYRKNETKKHFKLGLWALVYVIFATTLWMWKG